MQKRAPSTGQILVASGFALSCFGLLLFLWISFGGAIPLKPQGYRITADFPEATTLGLESDVRIGGVTVGRVKALDLPPEGNATRVTMEIDPRYAPISADAEAILRLKTLLGETYIELAPGSRSEPVALGSAVERSGTAASAVHPIPEGGHLADSQVRDATQIDDIYNALDPSTRRSFQNWQQSSALAIDGRGQDLNDALGNLGPFVSQSSEIVSILNQQRPAFRRLIRDTGTVFEALNERDGELAALIRNSNATFGALADSDQALGQTFRILPTFEREARSTLLRLDSFRQGAGPLVKELLPAAADVSPTLRSVRQASPSLEHLMKELGPLVDASHDGLPALQATLREAGPLLTGLDPFLANVDPITRYLRVYKQTFAEFLAGAPTGVAGFLSYVRGQPAPRHTLRQLAYTSSESLGIYTTRPSTNRGNAYLGPNDLASPQAAAAGIYPSFDCRNTDYPLTSLSVNPDEEEVSSSPPVGPGYAPCVIAPGFGPIGLGGGRAPNAFASP